MRPTTYKISDILSRIKEKSLTIPEFQRSFTWDESQVKLLIDSIARNYPIGSILLLLKSPALELGSRSIEAVIREGYPPEEILGAEDEGQDAEHFYVLDGQQRLTSLARVLMNAHPKNSYYFDLRRLIKDFPFNELTWVIIRARGKNNPDRKDKNRLIRSDVALDSTKVEVYVSEYLEDSDDLPELRKDRKKRLEASAQIKSVFETIRNYQIPAVILERDAQVESICRIFETINSTGTRLKTFDLAVAKFFPKPNLRDLWNTTQQEYPVLVEFEVDGERVLQTIALYLAGKEEKYAQVSRSALLTINPKSLIESWDLVANSLANVYTWARGQGSRKSTLPNPGVLVAIAAARASESEIPESLSESVLRKWYFCKVLEQGSTQRSSQIGRDFSSLMTYLRTGEEPEFPQVLLSRTTLLDLKRNDARYKAIQSLMATTIRHDLITGQIIDGKSEIEEHHIFPRRLAKNNKIPKGLIDTVVNRIPILAQSNRSLSDQEPFDYFSELVNSANQTGTVGDLKRKFSDAMIPLNPEEDSLDDLKVERFEQFREKRADLLLERIREVIGDSLINSEPTPDEEAEED